MCVKEIRTLGGYQPAGSARGTGSGVKWRIEQVLPPSPGLNPTSFIPPPLIRKPHSKHCSAHILPVLEPVSSSPRDAHCSASLTLGAVQEPQASCIKIGHRVENHSVLTRDTLYDNISAYPLYALSKQSVQVCHFQTKSVKESPILV